MASFSFPFLAGGVGSLQPENGWCPLVSLSGTPIHLRHKSPVTRQGALLRPAAHERLLRRAHLRVRCPMADLWRKRLAMASLGFRAGKTRGFFAHQEIRTVNFGCETWIFGIWIFFGAKAGGMNRLQPPRALWLLQRTAKRGGSKLEI